MLFRLFQGSFPCRPTTWLRVATSPQVGVSCIPLEAGGHRLAFPHSKAGSWQSGLPLAVGGTLPVVGETISNPLSSYPFQKALASVHILARSTGRLSQVPIPLPLFQHALRLAAFGQLHKVLGMDPLPSKMPKKPKNENPVDYTGKYTRGSRLGSGLPTEHQTGLVATSVLISFSSNPPQYHLRHYANETPDGGGWRGKVPQQKEEEDSEERYRHSLLGLFVLQLRLTSK